jgi:hypothetical protein
MTTSGRILSLPLSGSPRAGIEETAELSGREVAAATF